MSKEKQRGIRCEATDEASVMFSQTTLRIAGFVLVFILIFGTLGKMLRGEKHSAQSSQPALSYAAPEKQPSKEIRQDDYGKKWPFVRSTATIECKPFAGGNIPLVALGAQRFAFTGSTAVALKIPVLDGPEWLDNENIPGAKIAATSVRDDAIKFCGTKAL